MKVRFTGGRVRARIDDLELAALTRGESSKPASSGPAEAGP
ncbi:hypothetical protein ACFQDE_09760 [Deinococcus caeni]